MLLSTMTASKPVPKTAFGSAYRDSSYSTQAKGDEPDVFSTQDSDEGKEIMSSYHCGAVSPKLSCTRRMPMRGLHHGCHHVTLSARG